MARTWLKFRDDEVEVEYKDYGYEPDTNAHTIEWDFVGTALVDVTDKEQDEILEQLYEISYDRHGDSGLYD